MASDPEGSVTYWLATLEAADAPAARRLRGRYFDELVRPARAKLGATPQGAADVEDVALGASHSFCQGAARGRFPRLDDRDNLWRLLVTITAREALHRVERPGRKKRGGGRVPAGSPPAVGAPDADGTGPEPVVGREPNPEFAAMVADECRRLLAAWDDETLRRVALLRKEGYSDAAIAARVDRGPRAVGRKLE
jgi:hypothetical protein